MHVVPLVWWGACHKVGSHPVQAALQVDCTSYSWVGLANYGATVSDEEQIQLFILTQNLFKTQKIHKNWSNMQFNDL